MSEHRIDLSQLQAIRDGSGHSIFGASGSSMFLNCAGSLIPNLLQPDDSGEDAAYGTVAHSVAEEWRRSGKPPIHMLGTEQFVPSGDWGFFIEIDETMFEYVRESVDRTSLEPGDHLVEVRVDYSDLTPIPNQGGTLDFAAMRHGSATIEDDKYGKNETVLAEKNTQLMLYAYGIYREWDWFYGFKSFTLKIHQPRKDHFDEWTISTPDLLKWAKWAKVRMHLAWQVNAPRTPGHKQCQWCKVKATCAAAAKFQDDLVTQGFAGIDYDSNEISTFKEELDTGLMRPVMDAMELTVEQLVTLRARRKFVDAFYRSVDKRLHTMALIDGKKVPGMKLVEGRSNRVFISKTDAVKTLVKLGCNRGDILREELVSPAEAEKLLVKEGHRRADLPELMAHLVRKPPGKPTLVPMSDKRQEIQDVSGDAFASLVDEDESDETD
jgi:Protein of unknown function (DUF2800)